MFTGIIQSRGVLTKIGPGAIEIEMDRKSSKKLGSSIAVNGVCLTLVKRKAKKMRVRGLFHISSETYQKTTLKNWERGDTVNIESALTLKDALGGHIVQGHVDGVGTISKIIVRKYGKEFWFKAPKSIIKYIVQKGSVAVDGVSLTAAKVTSNQFSVALIPFTLKETNLGQAKVGDNINIEADIMAKYVLKYLKK